jgi:hypothetical protein
VLARYDWRVIIPRLEEVLTEVTKQRTRRYDLAEA